jgi:hypothetical protein
MPIDVETDELKPAAELLKARLGHRVSPATLWRWHKHGTRGTRLECVRVGGLLHTTTEALAEFIRGQNPEAVPTARTRSATTARRLQEAGLV